MMYHFTDSFLFRAPPRSSTPAPPALRPAARGTPQFQANAAQMLLEDVHDGPPMFAWAAGDVEQVALDLDPIKCDKSCGECDAENCACSTERGKPLMWAPLNECGSTYPMRWRLSGGGACVWGCDVVWGS